MKRELATDLRHVRLTPRRWLALRAVSARLDVVLFSAASAIVAMHAAVDAFVAPEQGTGPRDHLLRGFASVALLALVATIYPRLRAGARAAAAAVLGVLALEGAGLALAEARAVGARGENWTGFALAPISLALLGLAFLLLWRSRRPGRLRYLRRAAIGAGSLPSTGCSYPPRWRSWRRTGHAQRSNLSTSGDNTSR